MKRRDFLAFGLALFTMASVSYAADPSGDWKYAIKFNDQSREFTMKLKLDGDKLTGTVTGGQNNTETKIEDGTFKDNEVAFTTTRERNGNKITSKFKGKLDGDTIKGKIETSFGDQKRDIDWEAKREKK